MINRFLKKIIEQGLSAPAYRQSGVEQGFTLIETLAAVLLLTMALVGPMTIAQKGLSASLIAKDQNTAFNLAQDAVEYVRFARDTNCLASGSSGCPGIGTTNWLKNTIDLTPCVSANGTDNACYIDTYNNTVTACTGAVCSNTVNYDSSHNNFTYAAVGGNVSSSIFTRTVQIKYDSSGCSGACNPAEADITVVVSWSDPAVHSVSVTESLYNWQ